MDAACRKSTFLLAWSGKAAAKGQGKCHGKMHTENLEILLPRIPRIHTKTGEIRGQVGFMVATPMRTPQVVTVILNTNRRKDTLECLESVEQSGKTVRMRSRRKVAVQELAREIEAFRGVTMELNPAGISGKV